ncbi:MAG TPA: intradiol ring-cleavage dioxygenase [Nocardioides sp.]|nr:intradiol ring-cleavage dioxygenase [Nocardioides sp.]
MGGTRKETAQGTARTWRGRLLPRPTEDLEDQGLGFDVETVLHRRSVLRGVGLGALGLGLVACSSDAGDTASTTGPSGAGGEIPDETAGPYPGDGSNGPDVLEESGIIRSDIRSSIGDFTGTAEGVPMTLELALSDLAAGGSAFAGVAVYVWHCDREGRYSLYSEGAEDQNYLRGAQVADADGLVRFTSVFPACYAGRWPHIHFEVYPDRDSISDSTNAIATSQVALPKATCDQVYATTGYEQSAQNLTGVSLATDGVFADDGAARQLASVTGNLDDGYTVKLAVRVDTATQPKAGGAPPGALNGAPLGGAPSQSG